MLAAFYNRTAKISAFAENSDIYSSCLHYHLRVQTNRFYAKAFQFPT